MIVNPKNDGWEIFSHSAHGLLAGMIANEIQDQYKTGNWVATLAAIIEHDDRQLGFEEKNYLTEIGTPQDFLQEDRKPNEIIKRSKRLLKDAQGKSTWIAMLIAHHIQFINEEIALKNKTVANHLESLKQLENEYRKSLGLSLKELKALYQIMVFADRCSLILCQNALPTKNRSLEINTSIAGKTYWINEKESGEIRIEPWIFGKDLFKVQSEYKLLKKPSFSSNKEFQQILEKSEVQFKKWIFSK